MLRETAVGVLHRIEYKPFAAIELLDMPRPPAEEQERF